MNHHDWALCTHDPRPGQRTCLACHAAWMRAHRPKYSALSSEARERANCRAYTNTLIRRGKLVPQPCRICGNSNVIPHHRNYGDPRDVDWLCVDDHKALHAGTTGPTANS